MRGDARSLRVVVVTGGQVALPQQPVPVRAALRSSLRGRPRSRKCSVPKATIRSPRTRRRPRPGTRARDPPARCARPSRARIVSCWNSAPPTNHSSPHVNFVQRLALTVEESDDHADPLLGELLGRHPQRRVDLAVDQRVRADRQPESLNLARVLGVQMLAAALRSRCREASRDRCRSSADPRRAASPVPSGSTGCDVVSAVDGPIRYARRRSALAAARSCVVVVDDVVEVDVVEVDVVEVLVVEVVVGGRRSRSGAS